MAQLDDQTISLFSGKYDSVKQRMALLNGNRYLNFLRYTATLRLEMLLVETVYLTDAEWCDGLYFAWLTVNNKELTDLAELAQNKQLLKVFARADTPQAIAAGMFGKPFLFSSIESNELEEQVYKYIMHPSVQKPLTKLKKSNCEFAVSFNNYLVEMGKCVNKQASVFVKDFNDFSTRIQSLFACLDQTQGNSIPIQVWEKDRYIFECICNEPAPKAVYKDSYLDYYRKELKLLGSYRRISAMTKDNEQKERLKSLMATLIKQLQDDIISKTKNRSDIYKSFADLESEVGGYLYSHAGDWAESFSQFKSELNNLKALYNDRYNKNLAFQHRACYLDTYDAQHTVAKSMQDINSEPVKLSLDSQRKLALITWEEFSGLLNDSAIEQNRKAWLDILRNSQADTDGKEAKKILQEYIWALDSQITQIPLSDVSHSKELLEAINYKKTFDYSPEKIKKIVEDNQNWFIGNSSNIDGSENEEVLYGNEIGILVNKTVFRIKDQKNAGETNAGITDVCSKDTDYDTIIAPLDNLFNIDLQSLEDVIAARNQAIAKNEEERKEKEKKEKEQNKKKRRHY